MLMKAVSFTPRVSAGRPKAIRATVQKQGLSTKLFAQVRSLKSFNIRSFSEDADSFEQRPRRNFNRRFNNQGQQGGNFQRRTPQASSRFLRITARDDVSLSEVKDNLAQQFKLGAQGLIAPTLTTGEVSPMVFIEFESQEEAQRALDTMNADGANGYSLRPTTEEQVSVAVEEAKKPSTVVFLRRIPFDATKQQIRDLFPQSNLSDDAIAVGNGVAFVKFDSDDECKAALKTTGFERFSRMVATRGLPNQLESLKQQLPTVVKVKNAPIGVRIADLREIFSGLNILSSKTIFVTAADGQQVPSTIFLEFSTPEEAQRSLEASGTYVGDRHIRVFMSSRVERRKLINRAREMQRQQEQDEFSE